MLVYHVARPVVYKLMVAVCATLTLWPMMGLAEVRWTENGHELIFNMDVPYLDDPDSDELISRDVTELRLYIMDNTQLSLISVSGGGGFGAAGIAIAETILNFGLDTRAFGECLSACAWIFLAGETRTLADGAQLGFHRPYVIGEEERVYYLAHRAARGWASSFDYIEWIYDVALTDMRETFAFMSSRGVTLDFILEAMSYGSYEMWTPDVEVLQTNGVITDLEMPPQTSVTTNIPNKESTAKCGAPEPDPPMEPIAPNSCDGIRR